jgi:uncharacterized cupredoxin-like copper-binding protein
MIRRLDLKKLVTVWVLVLIFSLAGTACGAISPTKIPTTLNITVSDFAFSPASVTAPAGKMITLNLNNTGAVGHNWTVMSTPISGSMTAADWTHIFFSTDLIEPGTSFAVIFQAPARPGTYQIVCTQPGDFEAGMVGQFIVK